MWYSGGDGVVGDRRSATLRPLVVSRSVGLSLWYFCEMIEWIGARLGELMAGAVILLICAAIGAALLGLIWLALTFVVVRVVGGIILALLVVWMIGSWATSDPW